MARCFLQGSHDGDKCQVKLPPCCHIQIVGWAGGFIALQVFCQRTTQVPAGHSLTYPPAFIYEAVLTCHQLLDSIPWLPVSQIYLARCRSSAKVEVRKTHYSFLNKKSHPNAGAITSVSAVRPPEAPFQKAIEACDGSVQPFLLPRPSGSLDSDSSTELDRCQFHRALQRPG